MKKYLLVIYLLLQAIGLSAQEYHSVISPNELWASTLQHHLDSISDKVAMQKYTAGYCIYDLTADSVIYRYLKKVLRRIV